MDDWNQPEHTGLFGARDAPPSELVPVGDDRPEPPGASAESTSERSDELKTSAEHFHTPNRIAYVRFRCGDHFEVHPVRGTRLRHHLKQLCYEAVGETLSNSMLSKGLDQIEAIAVYESPERQVYHRVAPVPGEGIALDLCDDRWRAVVIRHGSWAITDQPPVMFTRSNSMRPLPEPARGGKLTDLRPFLNLKSHDDWLLTVAWLAAALRPTGPFPVLHPKGEQGTAKTTFGKILRRLFDPNAADLRAQPRDERELAVSSRHGWALCYDNLSTVPRWLSDALCRVSTGGAFGARKLHTDDQETTFTFQRPVLITSIEDVIDQPDLLDRTLAVELEPIPDHQRKTEAALWTEFEAARPGILAGLLDVVAAALELLPAVRAEGRSLPRMADFALFGEAVARVLGEPPGRFLEILRVARAGTDQDALEGSAVAQTFLEWIRHHRSFNGTYTELLGHLSAAVEGRKPANWPRTAQALSGLIRRITPSLRRLGVTITHAKVGHTRTRVVTMTYDPTAARGPSSAPPAGVGGPLEPQL